MAKAQWAEKQREWKANKRFTNLRQKALDHIREAVNTGFVEAEVKETWARSNNLAGLFWWQIRINPACLKEELQEYTHILCMPYCVTLEDARKALGIIEEENEMNNMHYMQQKGSNGWGISGNFPHIDPFTGNIHIAFDPMEWDGKIHQLILVKRRSNSHLGPALIGKTNAEFHQYVDTGEKQNGNYIIYDNGKRSGVVVPQDCYYPMLDSNSEENDQEFKRMFDTFKKQIVSPEK